MTNTAPSESLYSRIISTPELRGAFFNTTRVHLFADLSDETVQQVLAEFRSLSVAVIAADTPNLLEPIAEFQGERYVGRGDLVSLVAQLKADQPDLTHA